MLRILNLSLILIIISIPLISHSKYDNHLKLNIIEYKEITAKSKLKSKVNKRLLDSGTAPRDFWRLFTPLMVIGVLVVIMIIVYILDLSIHSSFPRELDIPVIQILSYILLISLIFIITPTIGILLLSYLQREKQRLR